MPSPSSWLLCHLCTTSSLHPLHPIATFCCLKQTWKFIDQAATPKRSFFLNRERGCLVGISTLWHCDIVTKKRIKLRQVREDYLELLSLKLLTVAVWKTIPLALLGMLCSIYICREAFIAWRYMPYACTQPISTHLIQACLQGEYACLSRACSSLPGFLHLMLPLQLVKISHCCKLTSCNHALIPKSKSRELKRCESSFDCEISDSIKMEIVTVFEKPTEYDGQRLWVTKNHSFMPDQLQDFVTSRSRNIFATYVCALTKVFFSIHINMTSTRHPSNKLSNYQDPHGCQWLRRNGSEVGNWLQLSFDEWQRPAWSSSPRGRFSPTYFDEAKQKENWGWLWMMIS